MTAASLRRSGRQLGTLGALLALGTFLTIASPFFLTPSNLVNVLEQTAINTIIAVGLTFVIVSGGIDLSVGSILALAGVVLGVSLQTGTPVPLALALSVACGALFGLANGALVSVGKLPPFIATLGMMSAARGLALLYVEGRPVSGFDETFRWLATGRVLHVPVPVIVAAVICLVAHVGLSRTVFGRYVYAIGGNEEASRLSGVPVVACKTSVYVISGAASGAAAAVLTARLNSAQATAGMNYELDAIAAAVIGGTSLLGGQGTVVGTVIGALIMGVLRNGLNLLGVSAFVQQVVMGLVIVGAVLLDTWLKRRGD